jgi:hypothetical protein
VSVFAQTIEQAELDWILLDQTEKRDLCSFSVCNIIFIYQRLPNWGAPWGGGELFVRRTYLCSNKYGRKLKYIFGRNFLGLNILFIT